jgi:RNA polymerase sigma factor (sigma-70 family)
MPEKTGTRAEFEHELASSRLRLRHLTQLRGVAPDDVEDVVQETLLEAWQHLDRLHTPEGFSVWLDEICRNICRRHARTDARDRQHLFSGRTVAISDEDISEYTNSTAETLLHNIPDQYAPDPIEALNHQDMTVLLERACGSLTPSARELVHLCYLLELPQREVAARLGLTTSALEARLHRTRRQLRNVLTGPLWEDAKALGVALDEDSSAGWRETRLWCTICGRRHLSGMFLPQPDGGANLHVRCPDCEHRYGLVDVQASSVHSKGLVELQGLRAFRPAWKRTMRTITQRLRKALQASEHPCPYCGTPAALQLVDKSMAGETASARGEITLPAGLSQYPYQFWVWWKCPLGHRSENLNAGVFAASDLVYWSHPRTQQFMGEHPRWVSEPELLVEHAGQPAIRFQMADPTSRVRLTVLAHRQTLRVLDVYS